MYRAPQNRSVDGVGGQLENMTMTLGVQLTGAPDLMLVQPIHLPQAVYLSLSAANLCFDVCTLCKQGIHGKQAPPPVTQRRQW